MDNRAQLDPQAALEYIKQGHGKATLVGRAHRYTYKFSTDRNKPGSPVFVHTLVGSDNEADYLYIGFLGRSGLLFAGHKGNAKHPAYLALAWYLVAIEKGRAEQAEFWHEGRCARCGRTLTTPESIAAGIGPVCAEKAAGSL